MCSIHEINTVWNNKIKLILIEFLIICICYTQIIFICDYIVLIYLVFITTMYIIVTYFADAQVKKVLLGERK